MSLLVPSAAPHEACIGTVLGQLEAQFIAAGGQSELKVVFTNELDQLVFGSAAGEAAEGRMGTGLRRRPQPVDKKTPWRREAQEPTRDKLREPILQNRQELENAEKEGVSEPAAEACSAASEATAETAPEAEKVKIWRCLDLMCNFKTFGLPYGHVGGGGSGSDVHDLDDEEDFTSRILDLPSVPPWPSFAVNQDVGAKMAMS
ncbi:unnamed protein product [Prorocentrum cordatum]|uniref:Uncharacterized protein n=1 Tax=Prorocentrum cordatum TaxID=2364126 RepID=A0ABN9RPP9_9DINO|nr:unnamed protein product [Polarella glacialis]